MGWNSLLSSGAAFLGSFQIVKLFLGDRPENLSELLAVDLTVVARVVGLARLHAERFERRQRLLIHLVFGVEAGVVEDELHDGKEIFGVGVLGLSVRREYGLVRGLAGFAL